MDRLLIALLLALLLATVPVRAGMDDGAQAVFFSMLFPQLAPGGGEATPGEAVALLAGAENRPSGASQRSSAR